MWAYPGTAQFFGYPLLSQNGKTSSFQIWQVDSKGPTEQMSIKNFRERERGRIQGVPIFRVPPIISGTGILKLPNSNFARTFIG